MKEYITHTPEETEQIAGTLARRMTDTAHAPAFVALYGDLGVGKTAFTRGFASVVSPGALVRSPTFALVNEYRGEGRSLFHFDMYRIEGEDDLYSIGFYDYLDRPGICIAEWCENIGESLPERYIKVTIEKLPESGENVRRIRMEEVGGDGVIC